MNIAIVGYGAVGKHYIELLGSFKKVKKIFLIEKNKIKNLYKKCVITTFKDISKKEIKLDYAIICTPSGSHYLHASYFLKKGIDTLIEKPFVLSLKDAKKLVSQKKKTKTKCWVAFQNRHNLAIERGKKIIKKKKFGNPFFVDSALYWHRSKKYYSTGWRGKYVSDGGVLFNQSIHLLDIMIYFFGPVKKFNVFGAFNKKKLQAEDLITLNLVHKNNIISNLKATTRADRDYRMSMDVLCDKGRYLIKDISLNKIFYFTKTHLKIDKLHSEHFPRGLGPKSGMGNGHKKILKEFLNEKIFKSSKDLDIEKNLYVLKLIHSIYNSLFKEKKYSVVRETEFQYKR